MFGKLFLHKSLRFYLELAAGILGIICAILFFILDKQILGTDLGFSDISHFTLIFILLGSALALLDAFLPLPGVGIGSALLFGLGIGNHLRLACYPLADTFLTVPFFTKDVLKAQAATKLFMVFLVLFLLLAIAVVVANFLNVEKKQEA